MAEMQGCPTSLLVLRRLMHRLKDGTTASQEPLWMGGYLFTLIMEQGKSGLTSCQAQSTGRVVAPTEGEGSKMSPLDEDYRQMSLNVGRSK